MTLNQPSSGRCCECLHSFGLLILRVGIGGFMLMHGLDKLEMVRNEQFEMMGDPIGLGNKLSLYLLTFAELVCSGLVIVGFLTRLAAIPVVIAMGVAVFVAHANDPWTMSEAAMAFFNKQRENWSSKEPALLFLIPFL